MIPEGTLKNRRTRSQKAQILEYLETGRTLTFIQAFDLFGCARLQARINDIRNDIGQDKIKTTMVKHGSKQYAQYSYTG